MNVVNDVVEYLSPSAPVAPVAPVDTLTLPFYHSITGITDTSLSWNKLTGVKDTVEFHIQGYPISNSFWSLTGNAGTNPATNFIGTTDGAPLNVGCDEIFNLNSGVAVTIYTLSTDTTFGSIYTGFRDSLNNTECYVQMLPNQGAGQSVDIRAGTFTSDSVSSLVIFKDSLQLLYSFGSGQLTPFTIYPQALKIDIPSKGEGKVLTSDANGLASWQTFVGTPIKDSIAATGATISPAINTTHVITSVGAITSAILDFPSGNTGDWIFVIFNKAVVTLTNSGTGSTLVSLVSPLLGTSKLYVNIGGNWY